MSNGGRSTGHPVNAVPPRRGRLCAVLLPLLLFVPAWSGGQPTVPDDPGPPSPALTVAVTETPDAVRLRIETRATIEPGSVELGFEGLTAVVFAYDAARRRISSPPVRLPAAVVEDDASAAYEGDALVVTLRKRRALRAAPPPDDVPVAP